MYQEKRYNMKKTFLLLFLIVASFQSIYSDIIFLKTGQNVYGKVTGYNDEVIVIAVDGKNERIGKHKIAKIRYRDEVKYRALEERKRQAEEERKRIEKELELAKQKKDEQKLAEILQSIARLQEQLEKIKEENDDMLQVREEEIRAIFQGKPVKFRDDSISVKTGVVKWKSAIMENAFDLENTYMKNKLLNGIYEATLSSGNSSRKLSVFDSVFLDYQKENQEKGSETHYKFSIMQSTFGNVYHAGSSASLVSIKDINGSGPFSIGLTENNVEMFNTPYLIQGEFAVEYRKYILKKLNNKYLDTFYIEPGISGVAGYLQSKDGYGVRNKAANSSANSPLSEGILLGGKGIQTSELVYFQGIVALSFGIGYQYRINSKNSLDARISYSSGRGAGSYDHTNQAMLETGSPLISGFPVELYSTGNTRIVYSGQEYEMGYTFHLQKLKIRLSYLERNSVSKVTASTINSDGEWIYSIAGLLNGDLLAYYVKNMDPSGPFPSAREHMHGLMIEFTYPF